MQMVQTKFEDIEISRGFRGSANLKRIGEKINWTKNRIEEYAKCAADPIYFCKTYMQIINVDKGLVPFRMYDYQEEMMRSMWLNRNTIVTTARQSGKALSLDTQIPTPNGFRQIKDIDIGDYVIGNDGKPTKVIFTSPIFKNHKCYKVTFDDKTSVVVDEDHQWTVMNTINKSSFYITKKTSDLANSYLTNANKQGYQQSKYRLPPTLPVKYSDTNVLIDPYTLGIWLGDGNCDGGGFTSCFEDLEFYKTQVPFQWSENRPSAAKRNIWMGTIYGLVPLLKSYSLVNNKHIPSAYMFGSVETRLNLLQGLVDTDGHVTEKGTVDLQLSYRYPKLLADIEQLIRSLGIKVFTKDFPKTNSRRLSFYVLKDNGMNVCRLPRKVAHLRSVRIRPNSQSRFIRNIELVESVQTKCIGVDNEDHLFLCTKDYIPTHNSTVTCGFILWFILFNKEKTVALLANKGDTAREIMGKVTLAYEHLPKWLQQGVSENNKGSLVLENNSRVIATATSGSAIRGYAINLLFIDEAAFVENWEEFFTAVAPTISSGNTTKIILVSTPNGLNHFYKVWVNAGGEKPEAKTNSYHPIRVTWQQVPGRNEAWRVHVLSDMNGDMDKFNQEYGGEFMGSSGTLISGQVLKDLIPRIPIHESEGLTQYIKNIPNHVYTMTIDVSKGKGLDYSAFSVFDVTAMPFSQVCVFKNNTISPGEYAEMIHLTAKMYNDATTLVEINNIGDSVANMLYNDLEYEGGLFTESAGAAGKQITTKMTNKTGIDKGINTTKTVKAKGCSILKLLVEQQQLIVNDFNTIAELSTFSKKGTSYEAESGNHDDLVMGLVLFAWLSDQKFFKEMTNINTLHALRESRDEDLENNMLPFGFVLRGHENALLFMSGISETPHQDMFEAAMMGDSEEILIDLTRF